MKFASNPAPYVVGGTNFVTVLDEASPFKAYQIFQATQILGSTLITTNLFWSLVTNGPIGVSNFMFRLPTSGVTNQAFYIAADAKDSDSDGFSDAFETLVLHTNPNQFNDTNSDGLSDNQMVIEWDMKSLDGQKSQGVLFQGNGFQITANSGNVPPLINVFFDQRYRGYPLKDFPRETPHCIRAAQSLVDTNLTHYRVIYDLQRVKVFRGTQALTLLGAETNTVDTSHQTVEWLDNMTDSVGTNGPLNLTVPLSNMLISNVSVQTPQFSNPSRYTYMGSIGNTSSNFYGPSMHAAYQFIKSMVVHSNGTDAFYTTTYNEGGTAIQKFNPANPQVVITNFGPKTDIFSETTSKLATNLVIQTNTLFVAFNSFSQGFRVPRLNTNLITTFTNGSEQLNFLTQPDSSNAVFRAKVWTTGTLPAGLSSNTTYYIRVVNETNLSLHTNSIGAISNTARVSITSTGVGMHAINFDGLIGRYDVATLTDLGIDNTFFPTNPIPLVPLANRVTYAVNPHATNTVAVYYTNETVVVYTNAYAAGWGTNLVIGVAGGYANGPSILIPSTNSSYRSQVKLGALWYDQSVKKTNVALAFQPNGKLWVGDAATGRMLRFLPNDGCDAWFMYVPHTYCASADPNNPQRVFNEYLEFRVDYNTLTPTGGWVLINYWGFGVIRDGTEHNGLFNVTTISNHTYALIFDPAYNNCDNGARIAELTTNGLRVTSVSNLNCQYRLQPDGALQRIYQAAPTASFARQVITSIGANGAPVYGAEATIATVTFTNNVNPVEFDFKIAGDRLITFNTCGCLTCGCGKSNHLGAVSYATNAVWLWQTMPTLPLNGRGNFSSYADGWGTDFVVVDTNIFVLYRGEFWKRVGQANQIFHYTTAGAFVGQFGMPATEDTMKHAIGSAGNMFTLSYVKTNGVIHLFTNDEHGQGTQVWRIEP